MFLVVVGAVFAFVFLMIVAAGLLRAAGLEEPTPEVDENEDEDEDHRSGHEAA